jgi:hypothetical protein
MKSEQLYTDWKNQRSNPEVEHNLTEKVMLQVYQYEQKKSTPFLDMQWLFEFVRTNSLARRALFVSGGLLGIARIVFIVCVFFKILG